MEELLRQTYDLLIAEGAWPKSWGSQMLVLLNKPGQDPNHVDNYRAVTLINTISKLFQLCLLNRMQTVITHCQNQFGFVPDSSCVDAVFVVDSVITKYLVEGDTPAPKRSIPNKLEHDAALNIVFGDKRKAFPSVPQEIMLVSLWERGIPARYVKLLSNLYLAQNAVIKIDNKISFDIRIKYGVGEGAPASPFLWNSYFDRVTDVMGPRSIDENERVRKTGPHSDVILCNAKYNIVCPIKSASVSLKLDPPGHWQDPKRTLNVEERKRNGRVELCGVDASVILFADDVCMVDLTKAMSDLSISEYMSYCRAHRLTLAVKKSLLMRMFWGIGGSPNHNVDKEEDDSKTISWLVPCVMHDGSIENVKVAILRRGRGSVYSKIVTEEWYFGEEIARCTDNFKYLGLWYTFCAGVRWAHMAEVRNASAKKGMHKLHGKLRFLPHISWDILNTLFISLVHSSAAYGFEIWGTNRASRVCMDTLREKHALFRLGGKFNTNADSAIWCSAVPDVLARAIMEKTQMGSYEM